MIMNIKLIEVNNENRTQYKVFMFTACKVAVEHSVSSLYVKLITSGESWEYSLNNTERNYEQIEDISNGMLFDKPMTIVVRNHNLKIFYGFAHTTRAISEVSLVDEKITMGERK